MSNTDVTAAIFVFQNNKNGGHFDLPIHFLIIFITKLFSKRVKKSLIVEAFEETILEEIKSYGN